MPRKNSRSRELGYHPTNAQLVERYHDAAAHVKDARKFRAFWIHDALIDEWGAHIGPIGLAVYVTLARHANTDGECWPSKRRLADLISASKRAVDAAVQLLIRYDLVTVERQYDEDGDFASNLYTLYDPIPYAEWEARHAPPPAVTEAAPPITDATGESDPSKAPQGVSIPLAGDSLTLTFPSGAGDALPVVQEVHHGSAGGALPVVQEVHYPPPEHSPEAKEFEDHLKGYMRLQLPRTTYETWVKDTLFAVEDHTLLAYVTHKYAVDWIQLRLAPLLKRNANSVLATPPGLGPGQKPPADWNPPATLPITRVEVRLMASA